MDDTPFPAQILLFITGVLEQQISRERHHNTLIQNMFVVFFKKNKIVEFHSIIYVFVAFKFLQCYKIMAYIQKKKAIPPLANIAFPFCDKIHFT